MVCLADAAHADPIPLIAPGPSAPSSGESVETPAAAGAVPAGVLSQLNPIAVGSHQLTARPVRRKIATPQGPIRAKIATPHGRVRRKVATPQGPVRAPAIPSAWEGQNLLGDMWGLRPALSKYGITLTVLENAETFGNLTGGVRQGFEVNGLTTAQLQWDPDRVFGVHGGLFNASGLQIWGGNLSVAYLRNLQTVTGIETDPGIRLWELWYEQKFGDKFAIKIGEQSLDQEFMISPNASYFINAMFGWPMLPTADLPGGGPAYPLASLGVRARATVTDNVNLVAGLFNGSPIPENSPNTPKSNPYGVSFPLNTGVLAIAELHFRFPESDAAAKANEGNALPGLYKIGGWYDSENFNDLQDDNEGAPLASETYGIPARRRGNYSIYALVDQMIWRSKDDPDRNLNAFIRPMYTPLQDRNLISFSIDAGLTLHEPFQGRSNDTFGVGMGVAQVSGGASGYNRQLQFYQPSDYTPVRSAETFVEATYQVQVTPWWQIQPDVQYIINPGAGIANPNDPTQSIKNELVIGLRTNITF
jgi:porin